MHDGLTKEGSAVGKMIQMRHLDELRHALDSGFDLEQQVWSGFRALDFAAHMGHADICAELLSRGVDINYQRAFGTGKKYDLGPSALHYAAQHAHHQVVRLLLGFGANPRAVTFRGATALHYAVGNNTNYHAWVPIAGLLLDYGADANAIMERWHDGRHWTNQPGWIKELGDGPLFIAPLHAALETSQLFQASQRPDEREHPCAGVHVVRALLAHGADPHLLPEGVPKHYLTPFQQALKSAPAEDVAALLAHGDVDLGQRTVAGRTLTQLTSSNPESRALIMALKTSRLLETSVEDAGRSERPVSSRASLQPI